MNRREILRMLGAGIVVAGSGASWAQTDKPIRFIVPYAAGGTTDIVARLLAINMSKTLQRTVIVENRPGAAALIGTKIVQTAPPDGDTVLFHNEGFSLYPLLNADAGYDPVKDFAPVSFFAWGSNMLVVHSSVPGNNLAEFLAWAKTQPNGVTSANAGIGTSGHLQTVKFARIAGIKIVHVPYKGVAETINALMGGQVQMQLTSITGVLTAAAKAGKLKILGTTSKTRVVYAPEVPSISETVPAFEHSGWYGVLTTGGTPADKVATLNRALVEAMKDPSIREKLLAVGLEPRTNTPEEFAAAVRNDRERFTNMIAEEKKGSIQ